MNTTYISGKIAWAVMENNGYSEVINLDSHKYLINHPNCIWFSNYYATFHPSGPNYRTLAAGHYITLDEEYGKEFPCVASLLQLQGKTTSVVSLAGDIATRHNPYKDMLAIYDADILPNQNIDYVKEFDHLYFGWNDLNNAHSGTLERADRNLSWLLKAIENSKWFQEEGGIFLFTWDESYCTIDPQHVFCAALSKQFTNKEDKRPLSHYNFCKTMYNNYGLSNSYLKDVVDMLF